MSSQLTGLFGEKRRRDEGDLEEISAKRFRSESDEVVMSVSKLSNIELANFTPTPTNSMHYIINRKGYTLTEDDIRVVIDYFIKREVEVAVIALEHNVVSGGTHLHCALIWHKHNQNDTRKLKKALGWPTDSEGKDWVKLHKVDPTTKKEWGLIAAGYVQKDDNVVAKWNFPESYEKKFKNRHTLLAVTASYRNKEYKVSENNFEEKVVAYAVRHELTCMYETIGKMAEEGYELLKVMGRFNSVQKCYLEWKFKHKLGLPNRPFDPRWIYVWDCDRR